MFNYSTVFGVRNDCEKEFYKMLNIFNLINKKKIGRFFQKFSSPWLMFSQKNVSVQSYAEDIKF